MRTMMTTIAILILAAACAEGHDIYSGLRITLERRAAATKGIAVRRITGSLQPAWKCCSMTNGLPDSVVQYRSLDGAGLHPVRRTLPALRHRGWRPVASRRAVSAALAVARGALTDLGLRQVGCCHRRREGDGDGDGPDQRLRSGAAPVIAPSLEDLSILPMSA
jgi:hypothetical protein